MLRAVAKPSCAQSAPIGCPAVHGVMSNEEFFGTLTQIEKHYVALPKHLRFAHFPWAAGCAWPHARNPVANVRRIRVERWVEKLCEPVRNSLWRKNRNAHAELLLDCILKNSFRDPFTCLPPDGALRTLPAHQVRMPRLCRRQGPRGFLTDVMCSETDADQA